MELTERISILCEGNNLLNARNPLAQLSGAEGFSSFGGAISLNSEVCFDLVGFTVKFV